MSPQSLGSVMVFGEPMTADRPSPLSDITVRVTVEPFLKAFVDPAFRCD